MIAQHRGSWRYLYERLGDQRFQQMCSALLVHEFATVTCFPVGQKDGGRDAVRVRVPDNLDDRQPSYVYQVKWTAQPKKDPVAWLDAAVRQERSNIERLVAAGATRYYLLTNVAGTAARDSGSMDRLAARLRAHEQELGIPIECWWQADIDARVDGAPVEIKWAFPDMLAGVDAIRYLIYGEHASAATDQLRSLLFRVIATQWREDARVKFKQVELESHELVDLFIDVEAKRLAYPRRVTRLLPPRDTAPDELGGSAAYLLRTTYPLTLVRGEPGQGKSTLGQYLCQAHRAEFLESQSYLGGRRPQLRPSQARLPLRIDLRDYARWVAGDDPFGGQLPARRSRARKTVSLEAFLAAFLEARSGGVSTTVQAVHDILARFPVLLVLDGLDEVAVPETRARIAQEIDEFSARLGASALTQPQLIVTTRPNATGLAEPSADTFEVIRLSRLSPTLRSTYLKQWAATRGIRGADRRALHRTFDARSSEPHIAQLADNPMQLTILLYLMQRRGDSVPTSRTDLYTSYMQTFLDREATKAVAVHQHRDDLEEVTAFLGWHMQSQAEARNTQGRLPTRSIKSEINRYMFDVGKDTTLVEDLFTAVTDRVWALTSKTQGTFEFDVQPLREYFAAKYLYSYVPAQRHDVLRATLLRHLMRRAYWLNTGRFYAGFANPNEIASLVEGLAEELEDTTHALQVRSAAWTLLADGVFSRRPRSQGTAVTLFSDDLGVRLMNHALLAGENVPLPGDRGGAALTELLKRHVVADPQHPLAMERMQLAGRLAADPSALGSWWCGQLSTVAGTADEGAWLHIGAPFEPGGGLRPEQLTGLDLTGTTAPQAALNAGIVPHAGSDMEALLIQAVVDGRASETTATTASAPTDLARLLTLSHFLRLAAPDEQAVAPDVGHVNRQLTAPVRQALLKRLTARWPQLRRVQRAMRFTQGQAGTTSPWGNSAREIAAIFGPNFLSAQIAVAGAATPTVRFRTGGDLGKDTACLGAGADYGRLLQELRQHHADLQWWSELHDSFPDHLSRATWALSLAAVADASVVRAKLGELGQVVDALPLASLQPLLLASSRLGVSGTTRQLPVAVVGPAFALSAPGAALIAHHSAELRPLIDPSVASREQLSAIAALGVAGWPGTQALTTRVGASFDPDLLLGLRACGPSAVVRVAQANMPEGLAPAIMKDPAAYPLAWLLAAERWISLGTLETPLADVAAVHRWFEE